MFHVLDPQEVAFDFEREAVYVDLETGSGHDPAPGLRPDYRACERMARPAPTVLRGEARRLRALTTDQPFDRALLEYLSKRCGSSSVRPGCPSSRS